MSSHGQDLVVNLLDGQTEQYPVNNIKRVEFVNNFLVLSQHDDVVICWNIAEIMDYRFDMSTVSALEQTPRSNHVLHIYPNPSSERVHIEYSGAEQGDISIEILEVSGRLIERLYEGAHAEKTKSSWEILSGKVGPGTYLCRVRSSVKVVTGKIVVQ